LYHIRAPVPRETYDSPVLDPGGAFPMLLATTNSGLYKFSLTLHILCAIVGFGAVTLNAVYGQQIKVRMQSGKVAEAIAVHDANSLVSKIGEYFIYAVFILGFALIGLSDSVIEFSQTWIWLSVVLYIVGIGLSHGVMIPASKRMGVLMAEVAAGPPPAGGPPPQVAEMQAIGQRMGTVGPVLNLLLVIVLLLMVWKPGL
jgi:hypothetical protein